MSFTGIKILKLISGQEVIGEILGEQSIENWIEIKEPRLIHIEFDEQSSPMPRISLVPISMFTQDTKFIINSATITTIFSPVSNLENAYRQQMSGIVLANKGQLKQLDSLQQN